MKRHKFTVGALVVATGLFYLFLTGFQQSSSMHATLQSLTEEVGNGNLAGQRIQLGGSTVVPGSIAWDKYKSSAEFDITDGERILHVRYVGSALLPDTFKDEAMVVLQGEYDAQRRAFDAEVVFAKCPSKYEGQDYEGHMQAMQDKSGY
jgi:cytochrome c-type biogenesis protein CcmE